MEFQFKTMSILVGMVIAAANADKSGLIINSQSQISKVSARSVETSVPIMLASNFDPEIAVEEYFISEKYDGVRAYWDGKSIFSRSGRKINAPQWFYQKFPIVPLDGELWIKRGDFERVSGISRTKNPVEKDWQDIKFMAFDLPKSPNDFERRTALLSKLVKSSNSKYLKLVKQKEVLDISQVNRFLEKVISLNGEGVILHHLQNLYAQGRSKGVLKLKPFEDAEAMIIAHTPGKGKYFGMLGAVEVRNKDGHIFRIGSGFSDVQRQNPPKVGTIITYRFRGKTVNDIPRFATFLRIRPTE